MTPSVTCPRCGMTSHHPADVREGYCGNCHDWTSDPAGFTRPAVPLDAGADWTPYRPDPARWPLPMPETSALTQRGDPS